MSISLLVEYEAILNSTHFEPGPPVLERSGDHNQIGHFGPVTGSPLVQLQKSCILDILNVFSNVYLQWIKALIGTFTLTSDIKSYVTGPLIPRWVFERRSPKHSNPSEAGG